METAEVARAVTAARSITTSLDLTVDDAIVLHNSNKLTLRLLPADLVARVAPEAQLSGALFEITLARQLLAAGCPVAALDPRVPPRVQKRDGFAVTLWTHYASATAQEMTAADYAAALQLLHDGMRTLDVATPHFTDRVGEARRLLASRDRTPALAETDRELLDVTLADLGRRIHERADAEQLLHGEPHPGNLIVTEDGGRFVDLETCCRGPVEFDLAHAPDDVSRHYQGVDDEVLHDCRTLVLAMITTWRWDRDDQFPNKRGLGAQWLGELRTALAHRPAQG
jgi:aminoglycoside phosphotransferase (APT) family kinase protein